MISAEERKAIRERAEKSVHPRLIEFDSEEVIDLLDALEAAEAQIKALTEERNTLWERKGNEKAITQQFMDMRSRAVKAEARTERAEAPRVMVVNETMYVVITLLTILFLLVGIQVVIR